MLKPFIAAQVFNTPLLVHAGKAAAILAGLGGRITGTEVEPVGAAVVNHVAFSSGRPSMGTIGDRLGRSLDRSGKQAYDMVGNVALIPIEGTLVHKGAWLESDSGETSYQGLQTQVLRAARDPNVRGVVFEVDSFGGTVSGAFETSDMIFALSKVKPTIAILSDYAYSAGYLMASAARQVVMPETGGAGSIGALVIHTDMSGALDKAGIKVTMITGGENKADGNPYEPLPDNVRDDIKSSVEAARTKFAMKVASYRGARLSFEKAMATEAQTYGGAEAVERGLADATGHPSDVFQAFVSTINRA